MSLLLFARDSVHRVDILRRHFVLLGQHVDYGIQMLALDLDSEGVSFGS